jgi:serine/threonine protein kinase
VLRAFKYLHSAKIIHRDLKPSNILLNENCDLQICDFGLSRNLSTAKGENLTEYVVTRYYRAPEIMLSSNEYDEKVDLWSAGCTLGEVMAGKILFPGQHYIEQINLIMNMRGTPDGETKKQITNQYALKYVDSLE